jgi:ribosomal protein L35
MPKMKTKRGAAKRLRKAGLVAKVDEPRLKAIVPYL